jgi:hypothetical protein
VGKRGKQSADALAVVRLIETKRPKPPATLSEAEADLWRDVVATMPADWVRKAQFPLLIAYCRHATRADVLAAQIAAFKPEWLPEPGGLERFDKLHAMAERETRAMNAAARALRLTNQSQIAPRGAGRAVARESGGPKPWDRT